VNMFIKRYILLTLNTATFFQQVSVPVNKLNE